MIVNHLTKSAHFLLIHETDSLEKFSKLYVSEIFRLHGLRVSIIFYHDSHLAWEALYQVMGTRLDFSSAFHPQTDGQSKRTIQILKDMLRARVLNFRGNWDDFLSLAEFAYNNNFQARISMAPYEVLYSRPCRSPLSWTKVGEAGPQLMQDTTRKVKLIRQHLATAQSRQKSYANKRQ